MNTSSPLVVVRDLHRSFGPIQAVQDLSFRLPRGRVTGFIGANGAGKTTTMRMMASLDIPNAGSIEIDGVNVLEDPAHARSSIGWMPDAYGSYQDMTVWEYLDFFARAFGYEGIERRRRVDEVIEFADLGALAERPANTLSKGMSQRLCLGRSLVHDPALLILDEPAAGLDPKARIEFKHLVRLLAGEGKTVFISSHILSELAEMCDTLLFIDNGRLIHEGTAESLMHGDAPGVAYAVETSGPVDALEDWVAVRPDAAVIEIRKNGALIRFDHNSPEAISGVLKEMIDAGIHVTDFHRERRKLEDAFVEILEKLKPAGETGRLS